jgi:tetratricopeptide (TPR) repeat protein
LIEILIIFAVTLALASVEALARRRRAARRRRELALRADAFPPVSRIPAVPASWRDGAQLDGGYAIGRRLGSGRFGEVFLVENQVLRRSWAAKITRRELSVDPERRRILLGELARGFAVAGHPHIVRTEMFRSFGEEIAIFSELVEGGSLAEHLADPRFALLDGILEVALQLAWALEAIHAAGMIHGDVKPANVLLAADGAAKLADLGLASLAAGDTSATPGTQLYRAPEQAKGRRCTAATDIWSWAVTVIAMLLGEQPSHADGQVAPYTLAALRSDPPSPGRALLDDTLDGVLSECLRKEPERRPTVTAIVERLAAHLAHRTGRELARPAAVPPVAERRELATELAAHGEAMRLVLAAAGPGVASQDAVLHVALAKVDCHRRGHDTAGAITTLDRALSVTLAATAPLRAAAWLGLGDAHHLHGNPDAALCAFKTAAAASSAPTLRTRAYQGTALALWARGHGRAAIERMQEAGMLSTHAGDADPATAAEARRLRAMSIALLADMLHECGDRDAAVACAQHLVDTTDPGDVTTRSFLARALLLLRRFDRARELLKNGGDPLLAAAIELEDAKVQARRGRPRVGLACARRARTLLRPHAERGDVATLLALAVAELHVAWLQRASGEPRSNDSIERALVVIDEVARQGRRDAAAIARWARGLLASQ